MTDSTSQSSPRKWGPGLQSIAEELGREWRDDFGVVNPKLTSEIAATYADIQKNEDGEVDGDSAWRYAWLKRLAPQTRSVLDLASGYGTAVFHGLANGYECFGIEPSHSKHRIGSQLLEDLSLPASWRLRHLKALGERLPFRAECFDAVISYQTLEHVTEASAILREMIRVTRSGGGIHLRCPDYSGTYEGHYLLPWFPLMPRWLARKWLQWNNRPLNGLATIHYVTEGSVRRDLIRIGEQQPNLQLEVISLEKVRVLDALKAKRLPLRGLLYRIYRLRRFFLTAFRQEKPLHLWIGVQRRPS